MVEVIKEWHGRTGEVIARLNNVSVGNKSVYELEYSMCERKIELPPVTEDRSLETYLKLNDVPQRCIVYITKYLRKE